jgi:hypothetical protein
MIEALLFTCLLAITVPIVAVGILIIFLQGKIRSQTKHGNADSVAEMLQRLFEEAKNQNSKPKKTEKLKKDDNPDYEDVEYRDA